ncbi:MAG: preprotein translocase subunit SecG [Candidatus Firestonebacteria bacterium]|nr:preprotein translocase subunit SecG [Candidatus Firestonebacteria bacterium]
MLTSILLGFHILTCVVLIIVVLLQAGKGSSMGLSFGGGASQTVFGSSGGKNFFARLTTGLAVVFMLTSIVLSIVSSRSSQSYRGVMRQLPDAPASQPAGPDKSPLDVPGAK